MHKICEFNHLVEVNKVNIAMKVTKTILEYIYLRNCKK